MRRLLLIGVLTLSGLFGMGIMRAGTAQPADIAGQFVIYLLADNYDAAYALFDPALQQTIPQTRLLELWNDVRFYGGEAARLSGMKVSGDTAVVTVEFERLAYEVEVSVDAEGQIYRVFFTAVPLPPSAMTDTPLEGAVTPELMTNEAEAALLTLVAPTPQPATGALPMATARVMLPTLVPSMTPTLPTDPRGAAAIQLARALGMEDYTAAAELFHPDLAAALSVDELEAAWTSVTFARGEFVEVQSYRIDAQSRTVVVRAELTNGVVDLLISIDADGRIFSLFFV